MELKGEKKQALVLGGGKSGLAVSQLLLSRGWRVLLSDSKPMGKGPAHAALRIHQGEQGLSLLEGVDRVVLSPGVPLSHRVIVEAKKRGLELLSELDVSFEFKRWPLIGITGTNGKSTTCALIAHLLNEVGVPAVAAGNIGTPLSSLVDTLPSTTVLSLELSSYQLEQSQYLKPRVAVLTSLTPDHLARHRTIQEYIAQKWRLFEGMDPESPRILTKSALLYAEEQGFAPPSGNLEIVDEKTLSQLCTWGLQSAHDHLNATCAVLAVSEYTGKKIDEISPHVRSFPGLEHRCEWFGNLGVFRVINDSKSTNVDATLVALRAMSRPCILLLGGQGKGESFAQLLPEAERVRRVFAFGAEGEKIEDELKHFFPLERFPTLKQTMEALLAHSDRVDADILLSPGCASFDEFLNFEDRGCQFKARFKKAKGFTTNKIIAVGSADT